MYGTKAFTDSSDNDLILHMCRPLDQDCVEIFTPGGVSVILTKEQFEEAVAWVRQQFEILSHQVQIVH